MTRIHKKLEKLDRKKIGEELDYMMPSTANAFIFRTVFDQLDAIIDVLSTCKCSDKQTSEKHKKTSQKALK